jgi:hypothetical protein
MGGVGLERVESYRSKKNVVALKIGARNAATFDT